MEWGAVAAADAEAAKLEGDAVALLLPRVLCIPSEQSKRIFLKG